MKWKSGRAFYTCRRSSAGGAGGERGQEQAHFLPIDRLVIKKIVVNYRAGGLAGRGMKPDILS